MKNDLIFKTISALIVLIFVHSGSTNAQTPNSLLPKPMFYSKTENKTSITITWYYLKNKDLNKLPAYADVYKKLFNENQFVKIEMPVQQATGYGDTILVSIHDKNVNPKGFYHYYMQFRDISENTGHESGVVDVKPSAVGLTPVFYGLKAQSLDHDRGIRISWKLYATPYLRAIELYKSENYDTGYAKIAVLPVTDTFYIDFAAIAMDNYYYFLKVIGLSQGSYPSPRFSGMYKGMDIPLPPVNVSGETIAEGVKLSFENNYDYTRGFYVFRSDSYNGELKQVSELILLKPESNNFIDSSRILSGKKMYTYAVKTIGDNYIESDFSEKVMVRPGVPTYIQAPNALTYRLNNSKPEISWDDLSDKETALAGYAIYRKTEPEKQFKLLHKQEEGEVQNYFTDTSAIMGNTYKYTVKSFDLYNAESNYSASVIVYLKVPVPPAPTGLQANSSAQGITLSWGEVVGAEVDEYKIHRYDQKSKSKLIGTVKSNALFYKDLNVKSGILYFYYVTAINQKGKESVKSATISTIR